AAMPSSARLRPAARTRTRISFGFGRGAGTSRISSPLSPATAAFMREPSQAEIRSLALTNAPSSRGAERRSDPARAPAVDCFAFGSLTQKPSRDRLRPRTLAQQRRLEAGSDGRRVHVALEAGRVARLDAQHHEGGGVAGAQETRAIGDLGLAGDRARQLDARA